MWRGVMRMVMVMRLRKDGRRIFERSLVRMQMLVSGLLTKASAS